MNFPLFLEAPSTRRARASVLQKNVLRRSAWKLQSINKSPHACRLLLRAKAITEYMQSLTRNSVYLWSHCQHRVSMKCSRDLLSADVATAVVLSLPKCMRIRWREQKMLYFVEKRYPKNNKQKMMMVPKIRKRNYRKEHRRSLRNWHIISNDIKCDTTMNHPPPPFPVNPWDGGG